MCKYNHQLALRPGRSQLCLNYPRPLEGRQGELTLISSPVTSIHPCKCARNKVKKTEKGKNFKILKVHVCISLFILFVYF